MEISKHFSLIVILLISSKITESQKFKSVCNNTASHREISGFEPKIASVHSAWKNLKHLQMEKLPEASIVYKVSELIDNYFRRAKGKQWDTAVEGVLIFSAKNSPYGFWQYRESEEDNGIEENHNWKAITTSGESLSLCLDVPHWHLGAVDAHTMCKCRDVSKEHSQLSDTSREESSLPISLLFIPSSYYIRFQPMMKIWTYYEGNDARRLIIVPALMNATTFSGIPLAKKVNHLSNFFLNIAVISAEWSDCSGEPIFTQHKLVDNCGVCGGDNSSCRICEAGSVRFRGKCVSLMELNCTKDPKDACHGEQKCKNESYGILNTPAVDFHRNVIATNKSDIYANHSLCLHGEHQQILNSTNDSSAYDYTRLKLLAFSRRDHADIKDFLPLSSKGEYTPALKFITSEVEIIGPDIFNVASETTLQVQPLPCGVKAEKSRQSVSEWLIFWHINASISKGEHWYQQNTKLVISRNALKPFGVYNVTVFVQKKYLYGIIYTASKLLTLRSYGVKALLRNYNENEVLTSGILLLDASESTDLDDPKSNHLLRFLWTCRSLTTPFRCTCMENNAYYDVEEYANSNNLTNKLVKVGCLNTGIYEWSVTVMNENSYDCTSTIVNITSEAPAIPASTHSRVDEVKVHTNTTSKAYRESEMRYSNSNTQKEEIELTVEPAAGTALETLYTFAVSTSEKADNSQWINYTIGYILNNSTIINETEVEYTSAVHWLHTLPFQTKTSNEYLPVSRNLLPLVKVCRSNNECSLTYSRPVKVNIFTTFTTTTIIEKTFENKLKTGDIVGGLSYMIMSIESSKYLGTKFQIEVMQTLTKCFRYCYQIIEDGIKSSFQMDSRIIYDSLSILYELTSKDSLNCILKEMIRNNFPKEMLDEIGDENSGDLEDNSSHFRNKRDTFNSSDLEVESRLKNTLYESLEKLAECEKNMENRTGDDIIKLAHTFAAELCERVYQSDNEAVIQGKHIKIHVLYLTNNLILENGNSTLQFSNDSLQNESSQFMRINCPENDASKMKLCHSLCFGSIQYTDIKMSNFTFPIWETILINAENLQIKDQNTDSESFDRPGIFEFDMKDVPSSLTVECGTNESQGYTTDHCDAAAIKRGKRRFLQCYCRKLNNFIIFKTIHLKKRVILQDYKEVKFVINADYNTTVGHMKSVFELSLTNQLASQLNISKHQILELKVKPGSVLVDIKLINGTETGEHEHVHNKTAKEIVQLLNTKIETGNLSLLDLDDKPLNISRERLKHKIDAEEINMVMGSIVAVILVIGVLTFIVSSFRKYRQEKEDSVRPIRSYGNEDSVIEVSRIGSTNNMAYLTNLSNIEENYHEISAYYVDSSGNSFKPDVRIKDGFRSSIYTTSEDVQRSDAVHSIAIPSERIPTIPIIPNTIIN